MSTMSSPKPYNKGNISRGSRIPRTPVPQQQAPRMRILDQGHQGGQVQKSGGKKRKSSSVDGRAEVLREEGDKTRTSVGNGDTFSISGGSGLRPKSIARRKSSALAATSFFDKDLDKMTDSQIENNYMRNELVPIQVRRLRSRSSIGHGLGSARSSLSSVSSEDSFKPSESQIDAEMKKNAILVPPPPKSTDNSGMSSRGGTFTIDGTPLSVSAFENAFRANANIIVPHYNNNSNGEASDQSNASFVPSESKIIEALKKHGPYVPPLKKSTRSSSVLSDSTDQLSNSVYEREFRKNAVLIAPAIKKSTNKSKTLSISSSEDHDQEEEQINSSKKSEESDRETAQITYEIENKGTFTKETQPVNVEKEDNLEETDQSDDESTIVEDDVFEKDDISKKLQRTTRKSLWIESIIDDSSDGPESTNKLRISLSAENNLEVSKKNDETITIEKEQEKINLVKKVHTPIPKPRSQSQPEVRITRKNKEMNLLVNNQNEKPQKINHSTPIKKIASKKKNLNHLNLSAISSQENDYNSLMSVKKPRLEKKQELLKLRKKSQAADRPIVKNVLEISFSDNEENINQELTLKGDNNDNEESETSFEPEEPEHLPSSCSINNDYDSETSIDDNENEIEKKVEKLKIDDKPSDSNEKKSSKKASNVKKLRSKHYDNENEKNVGEPKTPIKINAQPSDSIEKNVKKSTMKESTANVKKPQVILPKKLDKIKATIDKPTRSLRLRSYKPDDKENPKSPLKDPSSSPQKKKLRKSSRTDDNKNDKRSVTKSPIKKITRRSSIQSGTSTTDRLTDPVYEREIRKNSSIIDPGINKSTRSSKNFSISSEDHGELEVEVEVEMPKIPSADSNEKNVKKPAKEILKSPLKDPTLSPQKKKLRTSSSRTDDNKNDKSVAKSPIKRKSSIQSGTSTTDRLTDPVYEKEIRKSASRITPGINKFTLSSKTFSISSQDHGELEVEVEVEIPKPKTPAADSNEKNVKKSTKKASNIKKLKKSKVILPKKVGKINKATTDKLRSLRNLRNYKLKENSKSPLKDPTPSPPKKKLRTSSRTTDDNKNDKSIAKSPIKIPIKRKSSIQPDTTDQLEDPVYEREIRKNKSIISPEIKKSKTLSILSDDRDQDHDEGQIDSTPAIKSVDREIDGQKSIEKRSIKKASLKISSKYKNQLKSRQLSARVTGPTAEPEAGPSNSKVLNLNVKKRRVVKKKKSTGVKKVEYTKLYQLQYRLWNKMNPSDIKLVHKVMNNYIELFLNRIQSNCRNIHGKYTYLELERALAAEGLIPRKKGYLMSYMTSIFNTKQMKLVMHNGLFPLEERKIDGNNFPE